MTLRKNIYHSIILMGYAKPLVKVYHWQQWQNILTYFGAQ